MATKKRTRAKNTRAKKITAVDIAQDVIDLLKAKKIVAQPGVYFDLGSINEKTFPAESSLQAAIQNKKFKPCDVCGIGAMFMAYVDKNNEVDVRDVTEALSFSGDRELIEDKLAPYISERQLDLIEAFFEENEHFDEREINSVVDNWSKRYPNPTKRLIAICENMIANKGIFKPSMELVVDYQ